MSDRDVPSVPVTTLAGLTSLSDLLSELPVSGSISSTTSLNKSLLFHTLVAEESNNLLSVRDDNLVRQLVHAIEQTNSDQIELKSQYAINQHGTNISEYPELLQGIYTFRPTVFNTPQTHRVQNHQVSNTIPSHSHLLQQQQQKVPVSTISQNQTDVIVQQVQLQQQAPVTTRQRANAQNVNTNANVHFVAGLDPKQQGPTVVVNTPQNNVVIGHGNVFVNTDTPSKRPMNRRQIANELQTQQQLVQQQQQNQLMQQKIQQPQITQQQIQQQMPQQIQQQQQFQLQQQQQKIQVQQQHQPLLQQHLQQQNVIQQQQVHYQQQQQQALIQQQQQLLQQQQANIVQKGGQQQKVNTQQQIAMQQTQATVLVKQQIPQQLVAQKTSVVQQTPVVQKTVLVQQSPAAQKTSVVQKTPTPQKASIIQATNVVQQTPVKQPNVQRQQTNQILQQSLMLNQQQTPQQQQLREPQQVLMQQAQLMQQQPLIQHQQPIQPPIQQQKTIPRNNEYLEQQSKNFDLRGPSPAQASVAPDSNQIGTPRHFSQAQKPQLNLYPTDSKDKFSNSTEIPVNAKRDSGALALTPKVCLNRLKAEDEELMQKSLKKFAKKSPELARKLGIVETASPIKMDVDAVTVPAPTINVEKSIDKPEINIVTNEVKDDKPVKKVDTFSQMKADERKIAPKRKLQPIDEIPPEQIFSQPKLRRVERIVAPVVPKTSKEEIMKSQTYQQFMKNMEQIIEQLDDTEPPNFNSEDTDENVECISSKMLTVVSNDVAKLKAKGVLDSIPKNKLTLLINYAMRNVYLARNYSAGPDVEEEIIGEDTMEKILNAIEACLLICNIYSTARDLKFLQEDNISLIIKFVQFQFRETIFPSYDPVYIVKNMKKIDNRKKKAAQNHNRSLQLLYSKCVQLMKVFVTLFDKCLFVDTIVLALSTLAIEPFFVDNIETLQFVCLELVTTIFRKEQYVKMRSSILTDILASIDRLPCSKKNLRPFKLANNGGNIQMVTALVLQLIQCATVLPENICETKNGRPGKKSKPLPSPDPVDEQSDNNKMPPEKDLIVIEKYDTAVSIGGNFLTTFLSKCKTRSNETDFRPLFENFIHDLLTTVNKPEWPAAELLLSLLGTLLVKYMSDKTIEQSIRLSSLDYLGIVAARLRKDTVESRCKVNIMDQMIKCIKAEQEKEGDLSKINSNIVLDPDEERTEFLQKILLDFLAVNAQEENLIWDYARHFYLTQWYRDIMQQRKRIAEGEKGYASRKKKTAKKKRRKGESSESSSDEEKDGDKTDEEDVPLKKSKDDTPDQELNLEIFQVLDERKKFLLSKIKPYSDMNCASHHIKTYIDYNNAHLIAQYLATKRPFSQSFDKYLQKIILLVREPSIAIRTRAMKCLSTIVDVDPLILSRKDMQMGVKQKFFDNAISVREAAVDLVGKYVLTSEELIDQYYEMLITRILDTGVSVRKRVIKILRDICIEYPDFPKIPEICVKMIRRVHDEEGIQKLVTEVFMRMWFTPCKDNDKHSVQRKINQIVDVVNTAHDNTGTLWLDGLLNSIFTPKDNNPKLEITSENVKKNTEPPPEVVLACQQLADGLVERLIEEELEDTNNTRMVGCITTMHLLAKVRPQLLVRHAITIEPYLNIKCHLTNAPKFICSVAEILEQVVPLMEHPSDTFLADLEEHLMMRVVSLNQTVVLSCLSCLGAVVNKITKNYKLIKDCFVKFYRSIINSREQLANNPNLPIDNIYQPIFRRSLYTIGILMRYFDFKSPKIIGLEEGEKISSTICDEVFDSLVYFITCPNYEIRKQALISLGHFCVQNDEYLTRPALRDFYRDLLTSTTVEANIKLVCLRNIWMYLTESEMYMHNKEKDWQTQSQTEDLKEMNDVMSGMASRIIQLYLTEILDCFLHTDSTVRLFAVKVIQIVLRQGLVHPVRMVPFLICLSTDGKQEIAHRADALLKDIDKTYAGFVNMKLQLGLQLSFQLQELLQTQEKGDNSVVRGYCKRDNQSVSLNDFLYTLLRNTKPQRRALVQTVTKQFDDQKTTLRQMLYLADNLAYFSYQVQDEPLYLIHQIDIMISVTGTNLLATFKEGLKPQEVVGINKENPLEDDDDEEDKDSIFNRLPDDTTELQQCITAAQGCMLLLILKQHLKDMYGITDGKISRYSPSEPQKIYEKAVTRKQVPDFNPKSTIEVIRKANIINKELDEKEKRSLIEKYLDFKQLMLRLDPDDLDSQDEDKPKMNNSLTGSTPKTPATNVSTSETPAKNDDTGTPHVNNFNNSVSTPVPQKVVATTPTSRNQKSAKSATTRKQPARSKRRKRKIISSDEEESDYNSDSDYA